MRTAFIDPIATPLGYALLAIGAVLLLLPGPGIPLLLGGLALLARRRPWARRARRRLAVWVARALGRRRGLRERGLGKSRLRGAPGQRGPSHPVGEKTDLRKPWFLTWRSCGGSRGPAGAGRRVGAGR